MAEEFHCKVCGQCCRNLRGRTMSKDLPNLPPDVFKTVPSSMTTITLFEWEATCLEQKARELSLNFKAKPDVMFWDDLSKVAIVTQWNLDHDSCPFLSETNLCRINEQKPLTCQAYPVLCFGLLTEEKRTISLEFGDCSNVVYPSWGEGTILRIRRVAIFKELFGIYGASFLGMLRIEAATKVLREVLINLRKEKMILPLVIDYKVRKAILRSKPIGLLEYLEKNHSDIAETLKKSVESIYELNITLLEEMLAEDKKAVE